MALELAHNAYVNGGVDSAADYHTVPSIGEGELYGIGAYADKDPGYVLKKVLAVNRGTRSLWLGRTPSLALAGNDRKELKTTESLPCEGKVDTLWIYNAQGSGGAAALDFQWDQTNKQNSGRVGNPGYGEIGVRATPTANATRTIRVIARANCTLSFVKTWTKVPASGAACTFTVAGPGGNLLAAVSVDVTGLTTVTYQTQALTATTSRLDLNPGDEITITIVGALGLTPGDLLIVLGWTLR